jgi:hypothetical protein
VLRDGRRRLLRDAAAIRRRRDVGRLASGEITVFTAVPTIYHRLIAAWEAAPEGLRRVWSAGARRARLMMSGSAALPTAILTRWQEITGQLLLERYGLTEAGMVLSNPLDGERRPGHVGLPLPGVDVRLIDEQAAGGGWESGEVEVLALACSWSWRQPELTRAAFHDGWFRTGDVGVLDEGSYRLRASQRGHHQERRLQDLGVEIEDALRAHPAVADCWWSARLIHWGARARPSSSRRRRALTRGAAGLGKCTPLVAQGPEGPHVRARPPAQRDGESGQAADRSMVQIGARGLRWRSGGFAGGPRRLCREVRAASPRGPGLVSSPRTSSAHAGLLSSRRTSQFTSDFSFLDDRI